MLCHIWSSVWPYQKQSSVYSSIHTLRSKADRLRSFLFGCSSMCASCSGTKILKFCVWRLETVVQSRELSDLERLIRERTARKRKPKNLWKNNNKLKWGTGSMGKHLSLLMYRKKERRKEERCNRPDHRYHSQLIKQGIENRQPLRPENSRRRNLMLSYLLGNGAHVQNMSREVPVKNWEGFSKFLWLRHWLITFPENHLALVVASQGFKEQ